jgi:drug/metabolite transporter (DMT)-like permease
MWFPLALTAMLMLVVRRSSEKTLAGRIPPTSMAWLQQTFALPFIALALLLPMAGFYNPLDLSNQFYWVLAVYTVLGAIDVILYFKAISLGDISAISGVLSLVVVSSLIGAYFILGQVPSTLGIIGSACVLAGAYLASKRPASTDTVKTAAHKLAIIFILIIVVIRGIYSPLEVLAIRETDPFYFNFASSLLAVPVIVLVMYLRGRRTGKPAFSKQLVKSVNIHRLGLLIIGITYTINLTCTYAAKVIADNAAYVTTIKSTQVLPMMILGVFLFKEKVSLRQWIGLGIIMIGLVFFSQA